jgi:hypothetical protein
MSGLAFAVSRPPVDAAEFERLHAEGRRRMLEHLDAEIARLDDREDELLAKAIRVHGRWKPTYARLLRVVVDRHGVLEVQPSHLLGELA